MNRDLVFVNSVSFSQFFCVLGVSGLELMFKIVFADGNLSLEMQDVTHDLSNGKMENSILASLLSFVNFLQKEIQTVIFVTECFLWHFASC